jgi:hypothetical protein
VNVEINSTLSDLTASSVITTGAGGFIVVGKGGTFKTDKAVASLPGGLSVTGGVLEYTATGTSAANIADGGSITALLGKVSSGVLKIGSTSIGPVAIAAVATGLSENKTLSVTTTTHAGTTGTPLPLSIPVGLFLTTPGLTNVTNVTVQGGGKLIFSGAPGSLSLAVGSAFTLNEGGEFDADTTTGSLGLVLGTGAGSQTIITGLWSGDDVTATKITGDIAGGTISGGAILGGTKTSVITIGTFSTINLFANTTIGIPAGTIALAGTVSTQGGAKINFAGPTSVISGTEGTDFAAGTIAGIIGTQGSNIVYGTLSGQTTFAYIKGLSAAAGSIVAGSAAFATGAYTVNINTSTAVQ